MKAGPMRHRCMRRGFIDGKDALGQPSKVWGDLGMIWAEINIPSGRMYEAASQMQVTVSAEINIRYRKDVIAGQHLVHQEVTYEIIAPLPTNQRDMLKLMCKTVKPT
ncbi:phage head closure protein [Pseudomonas asiatica]|uniref:phage head closure protein n=1 Tax=Pseudomonas asiatica TaxID=2219225 RepID=UPI001E59D1EA|nr:phage head closure protein [Pseudomonas asiatica]MCE0853889.1 phage head closure protein [Pseudomonas asiatica]